MARIVTPATLSSTKLLRSLQHIAQLEDYPRLASSEGLIAHSQLNEVTLLDKANFHSTFTIVIEIVEIPPT